MLYKVRHETGPALVDADVAKHPQRARLFQLFHSELHSILALYDKFVLVMEDVTKTTLKDSGHGEYGIAEIDAAIAYNLKDLFQFEDASLSPIQQLYRPLEKRLPSIRHTRVLKAVMIATEDRVLKAVQSLSMDDELGQKIGLSVVVECVRAGCHA